MEELGLDKLGDQTLMQGRRKVAHLDRILGDNLAAKSGADVDGFSEKGGGAIGDLEFAALIRKLDKTDASWRH